MIGSLFSGIGGLELGLEWAGLGPVAFQVEINPFARAVLRKHWSGVPQFPDVRAVGRHNLPPITGICGGFPCQDISAANPNGKGLDGERSGLWFEYRRIVEEVRPTWVVVENVGRLARRGLDTVASGLHDLGYEVEATRILAADVGAPHLRERCFIIGTLAHAHGQGELRQPGDEVAGPAGEGRGRPDDGRSGLGDSAGSGHPILPGTGGRSGDERPAVDGAGPEGPAAQPRLGRIPDGLPWWVDGPGPDGAWPSPRGAEGAGWEAPRTLADVPGRAPRLRALGNAVVPQCAYIVGLRVQERLRRLDGGPTGG